MIGDYEKGQSIIEELLKDETLQEGFSEGSLVATANFF
jgi:hypothetical protein